MADDEKLETAVIPAKRILPIPGPDIFKDTTAFFQDS
jgi:hypothetical protein